MPDAPACQHKSVKKPRKKSSILIGCCFSLGYDVIAKVVKLGLLRALFAIKQSQQAIC